MKKLFLASQSPRRKQLLEQLSLDFSVFAVDIDESKRSDETIEAYVCRLAKEKAMTAFETINEKDAYVLGSDTVVVLNNKIMLKPKDETEAINMLLQLSGQTHQVLTAVALCYDNLLKCILTTSKVSFRKLCEKEANIYWQTGEPKDKAGSYAIQGVGAVFVEHINGSYSGIMGLPLFETAKLLKDEANIEVF